jgi:DnaJ-domain-containing protein 1
MKVPSKRTPVRTCLNAAGFSCGMLAKHTGDPRLPELGRRFASGRTELAQAERRLVEAEENLTLVRVEVKFEDHSSDQFLRHLQSLAEAADKRKGGKLSKMLFPAGLNDITKPTGATQVERMRALEARLVQVQGWDDAAGLLAELIGHRTRYEGAIEMRNEAERQVVIARAARNAAKERFLDLYADIAGQIRSIFPRDRRMQDLFFDDVDPRRRRYASEPDDELPEEPADDDDAP